MHDLVDVTAIELHEPVGWVTVALPDPYDTTGPLKTHLIQLRILSMHQNGRDTHIRQLKGEKVEFVSTLMNHIIPYHTISYPLSYMLHITPLLIQYHESLLTHTIPLTLTP